MDAKETVYIPRPVNYKRAVNSPMWEILGFLALKLGRTPNQIIDTAVKKYYLEVKKNG